MADWYFLKADEGPRGPVRIDGLRDGEKIVVELPIGPWPVSVRPLLDAGLEEAYAVGGKLIEEGKIEEGLARWEEIARSAKTRGDRDVLWWIETKTADAWSDATDWKRAQEAQEKALAAAADPTLRVTAQSLLAEILFNQNKIEESLAAFRDAMEICDKSWGQGPGLAQAQANLALTLWHRGLLDEAERYWQQALTLRRKYAPASPDVATNLNALGTVAINRGDFKTAESYYRQAVETLERLAPDTFDLAYALDNLAALLGDLGQQEQAEQNYRRSLAIRQKLAPESVHVARSYYGLGIFYYKKGDLKTSEEYFAKSLSLREKLQPGSSDLANSLNVMANLAQEIGDLAKAERYYRQALEIWEKLTPGSRNVAGALYNLGNLLYTRGDLETAEAHYEKALEIWSRQSSESDEIAGVLNSLGVLAGDRGDLELAERRLLRALEIQEKRTPGGMGVSGPLNSLGNLKARRGNLDAAERYFRRDLEVSERLAPGSLDVARSLTNLGNVAQQRGNLEQAKNYYERSLAIEEALAPQGLQLTSSLDNLAAIATARGDYPAAEAHLLRALAIREKLTPGSSDEARVLRGLGSVYRAMNRPDLSRAHYRRAIDSLEAQVGRFGGSEDAKAGFRAKNAEYYREYIDLLVEQNRPEEAFHVLERSRARGLLALLAERDLIFSQAAPEELEKERRQIALEYDRIQQKIADLDPVKEAAALESLLRDLRDARRRYEETTAKIRAASPRLAALQYPQPLDAETARRVLDPGTVLLSYSVGPQKTFLFFLASDRPLQVTTIPLGEEELRREVRAFRELIARAVPPASDLPGRLEELRTAGSRLYAALIRPAEAALAKHERLLIAPDGPLHELPWAALVRETGQDGASKRQYLAEWKPLHTALSATLFAELKQARRKPGAEDRGGIELAAFGEPVYPQSVPQEETRIADARVLAAVRRGLTFRPLDSSRTEVEGIAGLFGTRAKTYLGPAATEENAKALGRETRYLHFATHGTLDGRFPLNSAVVLTIPERLEDGKDNGLLQAWEIFERLRLDSDLVVLSACETGLGQELGGEGLIGLTRAFQYAGARSVAASLWSVSDLTTAELMRRFYQSLREGLSKDEALRKAQADLIRQRIRVRLKDGRESDLDASAPFFWAAFQIYGDWR